MQVKIRYYGWSSLSLETSEGALFFDPFFRRYCDAQWFAMEDFAHATCICVTHGHEEHFLAVPAVARRTGARVIAAPSVCRFLARRHELPPSQLMPVDPAAFESVTVPGFKVTALPWKHRDIKLHKALTKAVFQGNTTQLAWAWSSMVNAPFYAPYTGFHVELPDGTTVLNYNEGFNTKMTDAEIRALGRRFRTDILLGGMQLDFVGDVLRGVEALQPKIVVLYPPHEHFHRMMGVSSMPWEAFAQPLRERYPHLEVHVAAPRFELALETGDLARALRASA